MRDNAGDRVPSGGSENELCVGVRTATAQPRAPVTDNAMPGWARLVLCSAIHRTRWVEVLHVPHVRAVALSPVRRGLRDGTERDVAWSDAVALGTTALMDPAPPPPKPQETRKVEPAQRTIRVLIADDHPFMRGLIRGLLSSYTDVQVVGEAADGQEAVTAVQTLLPDVVIMDVAMPHMNGIEATYQISKFQPGTRVVALSMYLSPQFILDMAKAGAIGYVVKDYAFEELRPAIQAASEGRPYVSEHIVRDVANQFSQRVANRGPDAEGPTSRTRFGRDR
jgi:DNA-binding NarL/FixJ family response regulator